MTGRYGLIAAVALGVAACQNTANTGALPDNTAAIALMQRINRNVHTCWVDSGERQFRAYRIIPELDTRAGKPRILLVGADATQGLPKYVIEAQGTPARLSSYGPLASEDIGNRILADLKRWETGANHC